MTPCSPANPFSSGCFCNCKLVICLHFHTYLFKSEVSCNLICISGHPMENMLLPPSYYQTESVNNCVTRTHLLVMVKVSVTAVVLQEGHWSIVLEEFSSEIPLLWNRRYIYTYNIYIYTHTQCTTRPHTHTHPIHSLNKLASEKNPVLYYTYNTNYTYNTYKNVLYTMMIVRRVKQ